MYEFPVSFVCIVDILLDHFVIEIESKYSVNIRDNIRAIRRLRTACEQAKRTLSCSTTAIVEVESLFNGVDFQSTISRAKFEDLVNIFSSNEFEVRNCKEDIKLFCSFSVLIIFAVP